MGEGKVAIRPDVASAPNSQSTMPTKKHTEMSSPDPVLGANNK